MIRLAVSMLLVALHLQAPNVMADLMAKPESLDLYGSQVEGATMADGRLVAFVLEPDREIAYRAETAPGSGEWGRRQGMGLYGNAIRTATHADGRISIFIIGTLGNVLSRVTQVAPDSDEWGDEQEFDGSYGSQIRPVTYADGRVALFFLDMGREISLIEETAADSGQFGRRQNLDLNGNRFEVGVRADGSLDLAIIGTMANVLTHATPGADGQWQEHDIDGAYALDLSFQNSIDGALHLFYVDMQKEVVRIDMSRDPLRRVEMDLYGNGIVTTRGANGAIEIVIVGTLGNVLGHARQVAPDVLEWGAEEEMQGYSKWLSPVERVGEPVLFSVAPFASEVYVYH